VTPDSRQKHWAHGFESRYGHKRISAFCVVLFCTDLGLAMGLSPVLETVQSS